MTWVDSFPIKVSRVEPENVKVVVLSPVPRVIEFAVVEQGI
jgi:hypothetical protein